MRSSARRACAGRLSHRHQANTTSPVVTHPFRRQRRVLTSSNNNDSTQGELWDRTKQRTRRAAQRMTEQSRQAAIDASERTTQAVKSSVNRMTEKAQTAVQSSLVATREYANRQVQSAKQTTLDSVDSARRSLSDAAANGMEASKAVVNDSVQRVSSAIAETKSSTIRSFWWWSLGAVFAFGLAMSIPREIRLALENRQNRLDQKQTENVKDA